MYVYSRPVIIVFDSLGLRHVPTIKALRDYLVEEAKSKGNMDLAKDDIVGMHAKVPKQSNYCDCGVFLLHYVEKFLGEPERYLPDILVPPPSLPPSLFLCICWRALIGRDGEWIRVNQS